MKLMFIYIITVGILSLVLLKILEVGKNLKAPPNVSGKWIIRTDSTLKNGKCFSQYFGNNIPGFFIEQSGKYLELTLDDSAGTKINGELEDDSLRFSGTFTAGNNFDKSCGKNFLVNLNLETVNGAPPEEATGIWSTPNCSRCSSISFAAVKEGN